MEEAEEEKSRRREERGGKGRVLGRKTFAVINKNDGYKM